MAFKSCCRLGGCWLVALFVGTCAFGISTPAARGADDVWQSPPANAAGGSIVFRAVMVEDQDEQPAAAGKAAAEQLKAAMGEVPLKAVIVSECFEDQENKQALLAGVCSVLPSDLVFGQATYGSFTQAGCGGFDTVCLLGIGGDGIGVSAALVQDLGVAKLTFEEHKAQIKQRLHEAGAKLAGKLAGRPGSSGHLLADAHSPKNQSLVEGVQQRWAAAFPSPAAARTRTRARRSSIFADKRTATARSR